MSIMSSAAMPSGLNGDMDREIESWPSKLKLGRPCAIGNRGPKNPGTELAPAGFRAIGQDTDESSVCVVEWTPIYEGPFTYVVKNVGTIYERFYVFANW